MIYHSGYCDISQYLDQQDISYHYDISYHCAFNFFQILICHPFDFAQDDLFELIETESLRDECPEALRAEWPEFY